MANHTNEAPQEFEDGGAGVEFVDSNEEVFPLADSDRVLVVKRAIVAALVELMEESDFKDISVGDILVRSGVSRSTFYRCFADKYDVVNWSYQRYRHIRLQDKALHYSFESSLQVQLHYLADHQPYFAHALRYTGQNSLRDFIYENTEIWMIKCWQEAHNVELLDFATYALIRFAVAGMSKIIEQWVLEGCEQNSEEVARTIVSLIPSSVLDILHP